MTLQKLNASSVDFKLHLLGERFRRKPPVFEKIKNEFTSSLGIIDYIDDLNDYQKILASADIVISTSLHEFQGLSISNAVASGCVPAAPDRLSYRELFDKRYRYTSFLDNPENEATALCQLIVTLEQEKQQAIQPNLKNLGWQNMRPKYQRCFKQLVGY